MKTVKIAFSSSWTWFDTEGTAKNFFLSLLTKFDVRLVPPSEADYLFFSVFNGDHHGESHEGAVKILFTGENFCPDFNTCDYAISFEYLSYGDRHLRFPLYLLYPGVKALVKPSEITVDEFRKRSGFCNFIYSNGKADPQRDTIFTELHRHLPVHSAGRHLPNTKSVDAVWADLTPNSRKQKYMRDFRFSLALENSSHPGYVTEKITDAFLARTIPIYWGDPCVTREFNDAAFVNVNAFESLSDAVAHILALNKDEARMLDMLNAAPLKRPNQISHYFHELQRFLEDIFDQDLAAARRRPAYGFSGNLQKRRRKDATGHRRLFHRNRV